MSLTNTTKPASNQDNSESSSPRSARFLTVRELATESGLHPKTLLTLITRGKLPARKLGEGKSVWRITRKDWEAFLRDRERRSHQELHPVIRFRERG